MRFVDNNGQPFQAIVQRSVQHRRRVHHRRRVRERRHDDRGPADDQCRRAVRSQPRHQPGPAARSMPTGTRPARSSAVWARCTPGTSVSPRLGVTAKLTADGRTMLRASYGRFNQGVLTGEIAPIPSRRDPDHDHGIRSGDRRLHAPRLGGRSRRSTCSSIRDTRAPHTDEYSIGVDREIRPRGWPWRSPTSARAAPTSSDGRTSAVSIARRRGTLPDGRTRAGVRARQLHGRAGGSC